MPQIFFYDTSFCFLNDVPEMLVESPPLWLRHFEFSKVPPFGPPGVLEISFKTPIWARIIIIIFDSEFSEILETDPIKIYYKQT